MKWKPIRLILFTCWLAGWASPSPAIVIRHDLPDSLYLEFGRELPPIARVGLAHGVPITPEWVLTAAHVAAGVSPVSGTVAIGGREYAVERVVLHPSWIGDLGPGLAEPGWIDMALIRLAEPARDIEGVPLYEKADETGKIAAFAGRGETGNGFSGPDSSDGRLRGATNTVDHTDDFWLYFRFDPPPETTGLEGISGPGDSGGPALIEVDGAYRVAGIGSRNDHEELGLGLCTYGTVEVYARVSAQLDWLRSVMGSETGPGMLIELADHGWPATPAGRAARDFFEAYNSGSENAMVEFERTHLAEEQLRITSAKAHAFVWIRRREGWGKLEPVSCIERNDNDLFALVKSSSYWRSFHFEVQGSEPHGVRSISVSRESTLHGRPLPPMAEPQEE